MLVSVAFFKVSGEILEILFPYSLFVSWENEGKGIKGLCEWNLNVISLLAWVDFKEIIEILFLHSIFVCWKTEEKEKKKIAVTERVNFECN